MSQTQETSNFIVVIRGRGILHACLAKGTLDEVTERAEACLLTGFEVDVYSLKLATPGRRPSYLPLGIEPLQCEFHMWDAKDEFSDLVNSIVMNCDEHTENMAVRYIDQCIDELTDAKAKIQAELIEAETQILPETPSLPEPTFTQPDDKTTGI